MSATLRKIRRIQMRVADTELKLTEVNEEYAWNEENHTARQNELIRQHSVLQSNKQRDAELLGELHQQWAAEAPQCVDIRQALGQDEYQASMEMPSQPIEELKINLPLNEIQADEETSKMAEKLAPPTFGTPSEE